ncbi:pantothenate kinase [Helicobacter aurati]|uniref:Type III pantothenate kinase n=1 Tax=Helicobacter aurati TaxID=137778 RepID=A0A3D8J900_9HELI|nr:pantothenate kinase [Helicobacter aurati]
MSHVILCDIGNSFLHFYYSGRIWRENPHDITLKKPHIPIYYISVNPSFEKKLLDSHKKCINLAPYIDIPTSYKGLGIDRKAACKAIEQGVIIDAGSAITVDIVENYKHIGGYILPGISAYQELYKSISPSLSAGLNLGVNLYSPPQNTKDAISFGILKSILFMIKHTSQTKKIYFTGGDGKFFAKFFENAIFDNTLIFKGMQLAIREIEQKLQN